MPRGDVGGVGGRARNASETVNEVCRRHGPGFKKPAVKARGQIEGVVVFFFQAEDGIRDYKVTGVQTCALPILRIFGKSILECESVSLFLLYPLRCAGRDTRPAKYSMAGKSLIRRSARIRAYEDRKSVV